MSLIKIGFWISLLCLIPGLLIRIPVGGAGILLLDVILPIFIGIWWIYRLIIKRTIDLNTHFLLGMVFLLVATGSWIYGAWDLAVKEKIISASYLIRFFSLISFGLIARELYSTKQILPPSQSPIHHLLFLNKLYWILFIIILIGYLQFYLFPDISDFSTVGGFDPHIGRFLGTWMDPNFVAGLLGFWIPIMIGDWYSRNKSCRKRMLAVLILLCLYAVFLTFSRSGYLAAGFGLVIFFFLRDPKVILIGTVIVMLGITLNPRAQKRVGELGGTLANVLLQETDEIDPTASLRIISWGRTLTLWEKHPIFGIGYNTFRYKAAEEGIVEEEYFSSGGSDSSLLTVLVTTGTVGLFFFCLWYGWMIVKSWMAFWRIRTGCSKNQLIGESIHLGLFSGLCSILVHSLFVNSLLFPLILLGIVSLFSILEE